VTPSVTALGVGDTYTLVTPLHPACTTCMGFSSPLSLSDSEKSTVLEIVLDDDVGDGVEDKLDVVGVGGAREVRVDLLGVFALVQILELLLDVRRRLLVRVATCRTIIM